MSDDILSRIGGSSKRSSGRRPQLADPMATVSREEVATTTTNRSRQAGQYIRMTFTLHPDQVDDLADIANTLGVGKMELGRWLFDLAIKAYNEGARPQIETSHQKRIVRKENR